MFKFWEEIRLRKEQSHIMKTLKGRFKGEIWEKWHILPLVDITDLGIEVRRWVVRWLEVLAEEDIRL